MPRTIAYLFMHKLSYTMKTIYIYTLISNTLFIGRRLNMENLPGMDLLKVKELETATFAMG
jgi:hypothetical protein